MDLTLKSAVDFMADHKHILDGRKGTFTQTPVLLLLGNVYGKKESLQRIYFFVSLNWIMYLLKTDVLGYQQTSWALVDFRKGKQGKQDYY